MPRRRQSTAPQDPTTALLRMIQAHGKRLTLLERPTMSDFQTISTAINLNDPQQGMVAIDSEATKVRYYHDNKWRDIDDPDIQEIKASSDRQVPKVEDGYFRFEIFDDLNDHMLLMAKGFVGTVSSSGSVSMQLSNRTQGYDMLSSNMIIPAGSYSGYGTVNVANSHVITGDRIWVDVDAKGTNAKGVGVMLAWELDLPQP